MRRSILASMLEIMEYNSSYDRRLALFEIGPVFHPVAGQQLPDEKKMLSIGLTGLREMPSWQSDAPEEMDFYRPERHGGWDAGRLAYRGCCLPQCKPPLACTRVRRLKC